MHTKSIKTAAALLRANGVSLFRNASGEFQIRLCNSARNAPYYFTDDLDDAVTMGLTMAQRRDGEEIEKRAREAFRARNAEQIANANA
jgi:hypothetical protein